MPPFGFGVSVRATSPGVRWRRRVADGGNGSEGLCWPDRSAASLMVARGMLGGRCGCCELDQGPRGRLAGRPAYAACGHRVSLAAGQVSPGCMAYISESRTGPGRWSRRRGVDVDGGRHPGAVLHGSIRFNEASARWFRGTTAWPWTGECSCSSRVIHRISAPQTAILGLSGALVQ